MGCNNSKNVAEQSTSPAAPPAEVKNTSIGTSADNSDGPKKEEINFKPIHSAFRWNKPVAEVEALLTSPAAVNCVDSSNGNRPIHIAAQNGHEDLIKLLIKKNAELDAVNAKGNTGLHMSIGYDYYDVSKLLIDAGANIEVLNESNVPAKLGLEGDKCLGIALLCKASTPEEVSEAFDLCESVLENLHKINFAQSGLKAKKALGEAWTPALQDRFKSITGRLN